ncbi:WD repeat- and FYVE domain containing protein 4, partial [Dissostichus eleginoides]
VGIHHCAGGHLSSDSFVNVNYCSLSGVVSAWGEQYLQAALLRRTRNNKPIAASDDL